jgi:hypothetical protein
MKYRRHRYPHEPRFIGKFRLWWEFVPNLNTNDLLALSYQSGNGCTGVGEKFPEVPTSALVRYTAKVPPHQQQLVRPCGSHLYSNLYFMWYMSGRQLESPGNYTADLQLVVRPPLSYQPGWIPGRRKYYYIIYNAPLIRTITL